MGKAAKQLLEHLGWCSWACNQSGLLGEAPYQGTSSAPSCILHLVQLLLPEGSSASVSGLRYVREWEKGQKTEVWVGCLGLSGSPSTKERGCQNCAGHKGSMRQCFWGLCVLEDLLWAAGWGHTMHSAGWGSHPSAASTSLIWQQANNQLPLCTYTLYATDWISLVWGFL